MHILLFFSSFANIEKGALSRALEHAMKGKEAIQSSGIKKTLQNIKEMK